MTMKLSSVPSAVQSKPRVPTTGLLVILEQTHGYAAAVAACLNAGYPADEVEGEGYSKMVSPGNADFEPKLWLHQSADFVTVGEPDTDGVLYFEHYDRDGSVRSFQLPMQHVNSVHRTGLSA